MGKQKQYMCPARVTLDTTAYVMADSLEDAKRKFQNHEWDDESAGAQTEDVQCDVSDTILDPAFEAIETE